MLKIYHNNRCRKSREGLEILENSGQDFEIVNYLENPPSKQELKDILTKLGLTPIQLIRKNEKVWKEDFKGKELSDDELLEAMIEHPKLIERPIVLKGDSAVLGRPPENILGLL
ncbi:MAG: arsenate reductase (glutaredoxin) [Flavobacteriaceae bacterium]|nr:arsenate reductase (glutaredoxin) [Flavobacteriaceae bacterium]